MSSQSPPLTRCANRLLLAKEEWRRDPSLLNFLRVLLIQHVEAEAAASRQSAENWKAHRKRVEDLVIVLKSSALGEQVIAPSFLLNFGARRRRPSNAASAAGRACYILATGRIQ